MNEAMGDTMEKFSGLNKLTIGAGSAATIAFAIYYFTSSYGKDDLPSEFEYMSIYQNMFNLIVCFMIVFILVSAFTTMGLDDMQIMVMSGLLFMFLIYMTIMLYA